MWRPSYLTLALTVTVHFISATLCDAGHEKKPGNVLVLLGNFVNNFSIGYFNGSFFTHLIFDTQYSSILTENRVILLFGRKSGIVKLFHASAIFVSKSNN